MKRIVRRIEATKCLSDVKSKNPPHFSWSQEFLGFSDKSMRAILKDVIKEYPKWKIKIYYYEKTK